MRTEPWPWFVIGSLATTIVVCLGFAHLAQVHPDPLVVDDAYTAGLAWNDAQKARERADAAGWQLDLSAVPEGDAVRVTLAARDAAGEPLRGARLSLRRVRPTEGGYDADVPVDGDGVARVPLPRPGRWHLLATAERDGAVLERVFRVDR
jgi:nitrogen fixation protein FixH